MDVAWAVAGGLGIGFGLGTGVGRLVLYLRKTHREAVGLDNFLALGLLALAYGTAVLLGAWGFLAAFAAGVAIRQVELRQARGRPAETATDGGSEDDAVHPDKAEAHMAEAVLGFNEQVEKVLEVAAVLAVGALLAATRLTWAAAGLAAVLFLVIRPASVFAGLLGSGASPVQKGLMGWFGVRGIGSIYYFTHAVGHGLPADVAGTLAELVVWTVALSILAHGVSVTPLMNWYSARREPRAETPKG